MKRTIIISVLLLLAVTIGCQRYKTPPKIDIVLATATPVIKLGQRPQFSISLINRGKKSVTLVKPGEGSLYGWRTPIISWSGIKEDDSWGRCGTISALKKEEIFKIDPGKMVQLSPWTRPPVPLQLGTYEVAFNYENVPELD